MESRKTINRLVAYCAKHPLPVRLVLFLLVLTGGILIATGHFSNDISRMLPDNSPSARSYSEITRSGMFNKVVIEFHLPPGRSFEQSGLAEYIDELEIRLKKNPYIRSADCRIIGTDPAKAIQELSRWIPQLVPVKKADGDDSFYSRKMAEAYRKLLLPGQSGIVRSDPFGLLTPYFADLNNFRRISGIRLSMNHPYLLSEDGRHAMILLDTTVPVSDSSQSRKLLESLERELTGAPVPCDLITAHKRAVCNETVLKKDVSTVGITSAILFAFLFLLIYRRDFRSMAIPLIPLLASVAVLGAMTLIFKQTLFFVIGMGGIVISLAVDYGIHTYAVMTGVRGLRGLFRIIPSLCAGAVTSAAAFVLFLFSGTDGCRQFGFFAAVSLLLSLALMLLLLPAFLAKGNRQHFRFHTPLFPWKHPGSVILLWLLLLAGSGLALNGLKLHRDVRQFDVSPDSFQRIEDAYKSHFLSGPPPALLLFQSPDKHETERCAEEALAVTRGKLNREFFFSPLDLWPSEAVRKRNLESWRKRIQSGELAKKQWKTAFYAKKNHLPPEFCEPFFKGIAEGIKNPPSGPPPLFAAASGRFRAEQNGIHTVAVLFPDTKENVGMIRKQLKDPTVVSQNGLAEEMSRDVLNSMLYPGIAALFLVVLITLAFFRKFTDALLALLPVATSLIVTGAFFALTGTGLNLSVLVAAIILAGLAVDYGIFMTGALRKGTPDDGIFHAVTLSAVTSAAGGATVLFTTHPMLRYAGITLIVGITAAWLTSVFVLPALKRFRFRRTACFLLVPLAFLIQSCAGSPFKYEEFKGNPAPEKITWQTPQYLLLESRVTAEYRFAAISFLGITKLNLISGMTHVVALSPAGMKIFDIRGTPEVLEHSNWIPGEYWKGREAEAARIILADMAEIYRNTLPGSWKDIRYKSSGRKLIVRDAGTEFVYAYDPPRLIEKIRYRDGRKIDRIRYYRYSGGVPVWIYLENFKYGYRLTIRTDRVERDMK